MAARHAELCAQRQLALARRQIAQQGARHPQGHARAALRFHLFGQLHRLQAVAGHCFDDFPHDPPVFVAPPAERSREASSPGTLRRPGGGRYPLFFLQQHCTCKPMRSLVRTAQRLSTPELMSHLFPFALRYRRVNGPQPLLGGELDAFFEYAFICTQAPIHAAASRMAIWNNSRHHTTLSMSRKRWRVRACGVLLAPGSAGDAARTSDSSDRAAWAVETAVREGSSCMRSSMGGDPRGREAKMRRDFQNGQGGSVGRAPHRLSLCARFTTISHRQRHSFADHQNRGAAETGLLRIFNKVCQR